MSFQIYDGCTDLVVDTAWGAIVGICIVLHEMMLTVHESWYVQNHFGGHHHVTHLCISLPISRLIFQVLISSFADAQRGFDVGGPSPNIASVPELAQVQLPEHYQGQVLISTNSALCMTFVVSPFGFFFRILILLLIQHHAQRLSNIFVID
ncbi:hypothetical protein EDD22DRAFT_344229 [Suillus occidentalis]|nr:hypothetical protein EDD22DRAFT_344229 [Suillus occidentalis]